MTSLNNQQKQLLFDYCIGLTSEEEITEAKQLISSNKEAAEIHSKLKSSLSPLDNLASEPCPDDLSESTILRLNNAARSSQLRLQQLLTAEQTQNVTTKSRFWHKKLAAAAVFMIIGTILLTTLNSISRYFHQHSWQQQCKMQLFRQGQGINRYSADHNGKLPSVATTMGAPWWKVGHQGNENHSNTRHIWLLVRDDYVDPADFVCPGRDGRAFKFDLSQLKKCKDFPDRKYVNYSFRIRCPQSGIENLIGRKVLMADMNPLFETLPRNYSGPLELRLNKRLSTLNSINHNRRGQNVLFCNGAVEFVKTRRIGIAEDDIFTLKDTQIYQGCEVPSCETDIFLAP